MLSSGSGRKASNAVAIGIDLGTTNSCVAVARNGRVEVIANDFGNRVTPSFIAFTPSQKLVGEEAKAQAPFNPSNTIYDAKRLIGRKFNDPKVQKKLRNWPFEVFNCRGNPRVKCCEKAISPEEISSMVLMEMKTVAENYLGHEVEKAVITVPAYFSDAQRQATMDAASIAKIKVLEIINEPTAAAIAYGFDHKSPRDRTVLVFDLGGGTFDVAVLTISGNKYDVKAVSGDTFLGGGDFDDRLVDYLASQFERKHSVKIRENKKSLAKLKERCEKIKCNLSSSSLEKIRIESVFNNLDLHASISRARFEDLCYDLFESVLEPIKLVLRDSGLTKSDIDEMVLVGGSTRIPKIKQLLSNYFDGKNLNTTINGDEAVAYGAALRAAVLSNVTTIQEISLHDVTPLPLGINVKGEVMDKIIEGNTKIPIKKEEVFSTIYDYQTSVDITIQEGERFNTKENRILGHFTLEGIEKAPAGEPALIVAFEVDRNGILTVSARDQRTYSEASLTITSHKGRLRKDEKLKMIQEAEDFKRERTLYEDLNQAKNYFESFCLGLHSKLTKLKATCYVPHECDELFKAINKALKWSEEIAGSKEDFENRQQYLENLYLSIKGSF